MAKRFACCFVAALAALLLVASARAQDNAADLARVVTALGVHSGSVVADIGAGPEGLLTIPMAREVGPTGRVYASDLGDAVNKLRGAVEKAGLKNVQVLEGDPAKTNLPDECCDGIFIRNVYHHFADPAAMNASLRQALKPGGRLAILDFAPDGPEAATPAGRASGKTHGVTAATVARELREAGFEPVDSATTTGQAFIVVVRKPSSR
jgi:ubiquinone/menaquinone biosynthesis C-methylase UbiE